MKIALDMDSVLNDMQSVWVQWIQQNYDPSFTIEKWTEWDVDKLLPSAGVKVYDFLKQPGLLRTLPVERNAVEVTWQLQQDGHELYVVTAGGENSWMDRLAWLKEHFDFIPRKHVIFAQDKSVINTDVLVDDGLHNFKGYQGRGIVFDRPWNRSDRKLERAVSFKHLYRVLTPPVSVCSTGMCSLPAADLEEEVMKMIAEDFANREVV
jgi:5'(3')-deoxyribonucleotidase